MNRLEVVGLTRLAYAMLMRRGGELDAAALSHLEQAIEHLETVITNERASMTRHH